MHSLNTTALKELWIRLVDLKSPLCYPVMGFVHGVLNGRIPYDTYVDSWPNFKAVIAKPKDDIYKKLPMYRLGVYGDGQTVSGMLSSANFLPADADARFVGVPWNDLDHYRKAARDLNREFQLADKDPRKLFVYRPMPEMLKKYEEKLSDEFYIAELKDEKHIDILADNWRYGTQRYGSTLRETLQFLVANGCFALGAFTKAENKLVSWMMTDIDQAGMNGTTLEAYKSKGLHLWVMLYAIDYAYRVNLRNPWELPTYGFIPVRNERSMRNAEFLKTEVFEDLMTHFTIRSKAQSKM